MKKKKFLFLTVQQLVFFTYFILTTVVFFLALNQGNEGVTLYGEGDDGSFYWIQAKNIADGGEAILTSIYPLIIGFLLKITGIESVYVIRMFNYIGFILLVLFSTYLVRMLFKFEDRKLEIKYVYNAKVILLVCFLLYASLQMNLNLSIYRDVWIYMFYVLSVIFSIKVIFYKRKKFLNLVMLLISLWLLGEFREYALFSFVLTIVFYVSYKLTRSLKKPLLIPVILLILFSLYYTFFMDYQVPIVNMTLRQVLNYRNYFLGNEAGGSQMWIDLDHSFFGMFLINYIHSYIGNLLGPLPWHINGISTLFVFFVETIPMFIILRFLWRKRKYLTKVQRYVLLHAFIWISLIAMSNDNIGTATRLRPVGWILLLIVFVVVYVKNKYSKNNLNKI